MIQMVSSHLMIRMVGDEKCAFMYSAFKYDTQLVSSKINTTAVDNCHKICLLKTNVVYIKLHPSSNGLYYECG